MRLLTDDCTHLMHQSKRDCREGDCPPLRASRNNRLSSASVGVKKNSPH